MAHSFILQEEGVPLAQAERALLLFHGRGGNAQAILELGRSIAPEGTYLAALQATNNTWYPYSFMAPVTDNQPWLDSALANVQHLIEQTEKVLPSTQIYLMGFSQGACLTLESAARFARPFGGVIAFTGGLIGQTLDTSPYQAKFAGTRILMTNGDNDSHVPQSRSEESKVVLENLGAEVNLVIYPGRPHVVQALELDLAKAFIFNS